MNALAFLVSVILLFFNSSSPMYTTTYQSKVINTSCPDQNLVCCKGYVLVAEHCLRKITSISNYLFASTVESISLLSLKLLFYSYKIIFIKIIAYALNDHNVTQTDKSKSRFSFNSIYPLKQTWCCWTKIAQRLWQTHLFVVLFRFILVHYFSSLRDSSNKG